MRRYSEAVKADVRRRMSPPIRQSVAQISAKLGIHIVTFYNWRKTCRLQGFGVLRVSSRRTIMKLIVFK
jgi:transposase-like protein